MNRRRTLLAAAALPAMGLLGGCATPRPEDYAAERPVLDLARYFDGRVTAHGVFQDRNGRVVKRFTVQIDGQWQGDRGTLDERFLYSDGSTQRRVWRLQRGADGAWRGEADDVVGTAEGRAVGNALNWRYTLRLPVDGREWEVQFDDWMFLVDERVMLNRARMSKFGITLGEVLLSFTKG